IITKVTLSLLCVFLVNGFGRSYISAKPNSPHSTCPIAIVPGGSARRSRTTRRPSMTLSAIPRVSRFTSRTPPSARLGSTARASSFGVAGHLVYTAGALAPLVIGELIEDPAKRWRWTRLASVGTALAY
ncbi:MAG TPA: hypothetical protein VMI06_05140, partial [Terriglobia bacterium]|nr:hypothetical protein [Terriglobia bacterium]